MREKTEGTVLLSGLQIDDAGVYGEDAPAPLVLDREDTGDAGRMNHLIASGMVRSVHDTIERQIHDLVRVRARRTILPDQVLQDGRARLLGGRDPGAYGRWVFYPWSGRLVHLLPPPEFAELRLDRNRHKITAAEQGRLARFHVGVVGLAGGNAAAATFALEGGFGHLKLADFGALSLSALNRVRAGVHDLGTPRALLAARQIYEADPYASLELFADGVDTDSLDAFLDGLHAVVDACDDLHLKLALRERCRERRIAVLAETGERGTLDVERFDLEPARPVFHGRLLGLKSADVRRMDDDERAGLMLAVVGAETVSMRAAASLVEMRRTVSAWPRLGSDAALAAATLTVALRRLALGEPLPSGRRHVDLPALLAGGEPARALSGSTARLPAPVLAGVDGRIPELVRFCVEHALLAPSSGNRQPWAFNWDGERLWVLLDEGRAASVLDPDHRAAHLAVGAALENMAVAAAHRGWRMKSDPFPRPRDPAVVAAVAFEPVGPGRGAEDAAFFPWIGERATSRRLPRTAALELDQRTALADAARARGARLDLLDDEGALAEAAALIGAGDRLRYLCRELHREAMAAVRWSPEEAARSRDGLSVEALELSPAQHAALMLSARDDVAACLRELGGGRAYQERAEALVSASSAVGLVTVGGSGPASALRGGRAVERVWLQATGLGLALHPMTALLSMFDLLATSAATVFSAREREELLSLRARFDLLFEAAGDGTRVMLFRLGVAGAPSARTLRLPLEAVLTYGRPALAA